MKSVAISQTRFPCPEDVSSRHQAIQLAGEAATHRKKCRDALKAAGKGPLKAAAQKAYFGSSLARRAALIECAGRLPFEQRMSISEYSAIADGLSLGKVINETVGFWLVPKTTGGHRIICEFGVQHRAAQLMVIDALAAQFTPRAWQYGVRGKGIANAINTARHWLGAGYKCVAHLDIKSFFDSFNHDALLGSALPMTKGVKQRVVIGRHYQTIYKGKEPNTPQGFHIITQAEDFICQHGLPQGSACSPIIGQFFVSKFTGFPLSVRPVNWADDFLIMGKSPETVQMATNALANFLSSLTVGPFELLEKSSSSSFHEGLDFLGHRFSPAMDGSISVTVSPKNLDRAFDRLTHFYQSILNHSCKVAGHPLGPMAIEERLVEFSACILGWKQAFAEADDHLIHYMAFAEMLTDLCKATGHNVHKIMHLTAKQSIGDFGYFSG